MTQQPLPMPAQTHMLVSCILSLLVSVVLYPAYIQWLKKKQVEQFLREDGPESHAKKAKTPTMGGIVFAIVATVVAAASMFFIKEQWFWGEACVLLVAVVCSLIGFFDDYAKFAHKSNKGISGYYRLGGEFVLGLALGAALVWSSREIVLMPFADQLANIFSGHAGTVINAISGTTLSTWVPTWPIFVLLSAFLIAATANSLNLHDGMDGLAAGTSSQVFAVLAVMLFATGQITYAIIAACAAGALCGFLLFNKNPAKIFMGDTGSLYIGGLMGALVVAGGLVVWFVPLSLVYIAEALSVMLQVTYFKLTKKLEGEEKMPLPKVVFIKLRKRIPGEGKRIFRMAPLHHHYEAVLGEKGFAEWQVVAMFWFAQFILCVATLLVFFAFQG